PAAHFPHAGVAAARPDGGAGRGPAGVPGVVEVSRSRSRVPPAPPVDDSDRTCGQASATHPRALLLCYAASAEFAPDPALDPLWISYWEPFHGAIKKDFGFQITVKVAPQDEPEAKKNNKQ